MEQHLGTMAMKILRVVAYSCVMLGLASATGCGSSFGRTKAERVHMYKTITRSEWRMAKDDFDNFLLMDERSRLTRWY